jgi:CRISPR-associated protein Cas2
MAMTLVVTRDVPLRFRGFLASCMLEIAPGVYTGPKMTRAVRERVWGVMVDWYDVTRQGSVLMTWPDIKRPGGQAIVTVGLPHKQIMVRDGMYLVHRNTKLF